MPSRERYTVIVRLTVDERTDEHLRTVPAIKEEIQSWLSDLEASVEQVSVLKDAEEIAG